MFAKLTGELRGQNCLDVFGFDCIDSTGEKEILFKSVSRLCYYVDEQLHDLLLLAVLKSFQKKIETERPFRIPALGLFTAFRRREAPFNL